MVNIRIANDCVLFEDMKGLGKKLKELRLEKNLSQVELAKKISTFLTELYLIGKQTKSNPIWQQ